MALCFSSVATIVGPAGPVSAQIAKGAPQWTTSPGEPEAAQPAAPGLGGPGAVANQIRQTDQAQQRPGPSWPTIPSIERYGLELGADYQVLYQHATESLGEDTALGGVARFYGHWSPGNPPEGDVAQLVFKVENRHRLADEISPQELAPEIGAAGLTALTFSDAGNVLTNLYWEQTFASNRVGFLAGIVDATDYVDLYGFSNVWTEFNNYAFAINPTIPVPNQGIGGAFRSFIGSNVYIHGGVADANGDPENPGDALTSFFDTREYFKHVEIGWIGSFENRFSDNAHLTFWQADEREEAGVDGGWGMALSFNRLLEGRWNPFIRAGYADGGGAPFDRLVSTGFGYQLERRSDYAAFGASWGRPPTEQAGGRGEDQYTFEAFYRFELFKHLQVTPSVQYILDPAFNPSADEIWVPGLRVRAAF